MKFVATIFLSLVFIFSGSIFSQDKTQTTEQLSPPPQIDLTQEEKDWWKAVELAGSEAAKAGKQVESLVAKFKEKKPESTRAQAIENIQPEILRSLKDAREKYFNLLSQGVEKKFRVSVASARPKVLFVPTPAYTKEGRTQMICGVVTVRTEIAPNGVPLSATVIKSFQTRCPTLSETANGKSPKEPISENPPPLGQGLETVATETALEILFIPAIENHHLVKSRAKIEIHFNVV